MASRPWLPAALGASLAAGAAVLLLNRDPNPPAVTQAPQLTPPPAAGAGLTIPIPTPQASAPRKEFETPTPSPTPDLGSLAQALAAHPKDGHDADQAMLDAIAALQHREDGEARMTALILDPGAEPRLRRHLARLLVVERPGPLLDLLYRAGHDGGDPLGTALAREAASHTVAGSWREPLPAWTASDAVRECLMRLSADPAEPLASLGVHGLRAWAGRDPAACSRLMEVAAGVGTESVRTAALGALLRTGDARAAALARALAEDPSQPQGLRNYARRPPGRPSP